MEPTTQVVTTVGSTLAIFGAFAAWLIRYMDRRFEELKADTRRQFADMQRQLDEFKAETQRQFAGVERRFTGVERQFTGVLGQFSSVQRQFADVQRQLAEAREDTRRGFHETREDYRRLEGKLDAHGEQIAGLRQDVGRLQGVVERSLHPERFTMVAEREAAAGEGVRETKTDYITTRGGRESRQDDEA